MRTSRDSQERRVRTEKSCDVEKAEAKAVRRVAPLMTGGCSQNNNRLQSVYSGPSITDLQGKKTHQRETFLGAPQKERWALRSKLGLVDCSYDWPCWVVVMHCRSKLRLVVMQEDHRDSDLFLWTVSWFFSTLGLGTKTDDLSSVPGNSTVEREGQFPFP